MEEARRKEKLLSVVDKKKVGVNKEFVDQISKILPTLFPSFFCREVGLLGAHTCCLLARTVASIWLANMDGKIAKAIVKGKERMMFPLPCT